MAMISNLQPSLSKIRSTKTKTLPNLDISLIPKKETPWLTPNNGRANIQCTTMVNNGFIQVNMLTRLKFIMGVLIQENSMNSRTSCMKTKTHLNSDISIIQTKEIQWLTKFLSNLNLLMGQVIMIILMDQGTPTALIQDIIMKLPDKLETETGILNNDCNYLSIIIESPIKRRLNRIV